MITRRRLLLHTSLGLLGASRMTRSRAQSAIQPGFDPFTLGVASGDPTPTSIVLWTRLAPDPLNGGGIEPVEVPVGWEIALDDTFTTIVQSGIALATPQWAHSLHIEVENLESGRTYWYRFLVGDAISPVGRTRTAPARDSALEQIRFAFGSCANWEHGYFSAYRDLADRPIDFVVFLGDYFYEYPPDTDYQSAQNAPVRLHTGGEVLTLDDYRNRHALYRTDPDLQRAHQMHPWIVTWDDHEVENNYAGETSGSGLDPGAFVARRTAAYQAYYEHMPLRSSSIPAGPNLSLSRRFSFSRDVSLSILDTRQYRSPHPCGNSIGPRCDASLDPSLTMLGNDQEAWLTDHLANGTERWKILGQQVMMGELRVPQPGGDDLFNDDQWDGYPLARNRIFDAVNPDTTGNLVVLSGDVHSAWVNDLHANFLEPDSPAIGAELVASSITARNPLGPALALALPGNPSSRFLDLRHGYTICDLSSERLLATFRATASVDRPDAAFEDIATFAIEAGKPTADFA